MALSISVKAGEAVLIGEAIVTIEQHPRRQAVFKMRVDAPRSVQIVRESAKLKGRRDETQPAPARA